MKPRLETQDTVHLRMQGLNMASSSQSKCTGLI